MLLFGGRDISQHYISLILQEEERVNWSVVYLHGALNYAHNVASNIVPNIKIYHCQTGVKCLHCETLQYGDFLWLQLQDC